jgi:glycosyltransferase involved in cell wall biosynthesis
MKVLIAHNYYQRPGGEDQVFRTEADLLEQRGHQVIRETIHNDATRDLGSIALGIKSIWNQHSYRRFQALVRQEKPDVVHFHNTFPLLSPAVYYASRQEGAAVVQTLHNYRLACPSATLFRNGQICENCVNKHIKWPAIRHRCYRGSHLASTATVALLATHQLIGTWHHQVDAFIAVSSFLAGKVIESGLPADKVIVKPNCIYPDPGLGNHAGGYALYLGRLTPEKGISTLLEAWRELGSQLPLKIAGDGPLAAEVARAQLQIPGVEWLGHQDQTQVRKLLHGARVLVAPSIWYEGIPMTVIEALAVGTPVVASRLGSLERYLDQGRTGMLFAPGNAADLAATVRSLVADPELEARLSSQGRLEYEARFSGDRTYEQLMRLYATFRPNPARAGTNATRSMV